METSISAIQGRGMEGDLAEDLNNKAYVEILSNCEKAIIKSVNLEAKRKVTVLDERLKYIDSLIDLINTLEDNTLEGLDLPPKDQSIFSLCMLKKKQTSMEIMRDEFEKVLIEINDFRTN